jgi:ribosomal protein S18 acetylase RimI-like enzyme
MKVELIESVDEFITATTGYRDADPLRTNVIGSVSLAVAAGDRTYVDYHWWIVRDDDGDVLGIAMHTNPFNMMVSSMPKEASRILGRNVGHVDDALPGITGPKEVLDAFLEGYVESKSPGSVRALVEQRRDLLYELEELITPDVEGLGRPARDEETEELARMLVQFADEAAVQSLSLAQARDTTVRKLEDGSLFCWDVEGAIVAIAGHAPIVMTDSIAIGRVGPVYTPPAYRRHGYGSAVTAHVSSHLIEKGARVMLFTDSSNPTSNAIYQEIGYRLVDELVEMRFAEP